MKLKPYIHTEVPDPYPGVSTKHKFRSITCSSNPLFDFLLLRTLLSSISLHQWGYGRVDACTSIILFVVSESPGLLINGLGPLRPPVVVFADRGSTCTISSHVCTMLLIKDVFPIPCSLLSMFEFSHKTYAPEKFTRITSNQRL
jgi:hypothetical protein